MRPSSSLKIVRQFGCVVIASFMVALGAISDADSADEPDVIFRRSTVFKWLTPNDKLATYGLDDPEVEGVACHFTVPERGGFKGWIGIAEEVSDISLSCRQIGPIVFKTKFEQGEDVFRLRRSLFQKNADRPGLRRKTERPCLHGLQRQNYRGLSQKLDLISPDYAVGSRNRRTMRGLDLQVANHEHSNGPHLTIN
jgi:catabolite regulation protein CreA